MLNYVLKLKANPDNPAFNCVFHPVYEDLHDVHKNEPKPLSLRQILADFPGFRQIFTDGSKSEDGRVGAAAVMDGRVFTRRLADGSAWQEIGSPAPGVDP
nr:hypothetical protein BaRGS_009168 [Batillaria attramentaria]